MLFPTVLIAAVLHCAGTYDPRCPLYGDVDGDGRADAVFVERSGPCRFALVVRTRTRTLHAPVRAQPCSKQSDGWDMGLPRVIALRPMTARRGFEPEVVLWRGASNDGVRFFTVFRGRLRPLGDEWNLGGFAAAYTLTDCLRPHVVGVSGAMYDAGRWRAFGAIYRVTATAFRRVASRTALLHHDPGGAMWPHVGGDYFRRCHGVARVPEL